MNIILTTPLDGDVLAQLYARIRDTTDTHICCINKYTKYMSYDKNKESFLKDYDFSGFKPEKFYKTGQAKSYHEMKLSHICKIKMIGGVVEDSYATDGVNNSIESTKVMLQNIKDYTTACGKERIAEDILDACCETIYNPVFCNIIMCYDKDTLDVLKNFFAQIYAPYETMAFINETTNILREAGKAVDIELACDHATYEIEAKYITEGPDYEKNLAPVLEDIALCVVETKKEDTNEENTRTEDDEQQVDHTQ
jgi:hypothetical protein